MKIPKISDEDLRSVIVIKKETRTGEYICDCPFCGKDMHFYISKKTQMFDCKKCHVSGNIYKLLKHFDKLYLLGEKTVEINLKSIKEIQREKNDNTIALSELPVINMPPGFKICCDDYLRGRGLTLLDCKRFSIGKTNIVFRLKNYVLIPIYDNGKIRGYVGRYDSKKIPEGKLRYNNSKKTNFANLLYGYDDIIKGITKTVIITEGIFDMISVTKKLQLYKDDYVKCVCTFGKKISDAQIQKLVNKEISNVIISWDYDALKEIKQYGLQLENYFNVGVAVSTEKKDIDECTEKEVQQVFMNVRAIEDFNWNIISRLK